MAYYGLTSDAGFMVAELLTITDKRRLAKLLGVTERTVYSWTQGIEPRDEVKQRLANLASMVEDIKTIAEGGRLPQPHDHCPAGLCPLRERRDRLSVI